MSKDNAKDSPEQKEPPTDPNMPNLSSFVPTSLSSVWSNLNYSLLTDCPAHESSQQNNGTNAEDCEIESMERPL